MIFFILTKTAILFISPHLGDAIAKAMENGEKPMATTRRNLIASVFATAAVPTLAFAAASTAPHPIFAAMEAHRAAWHQLDDALTNVHVLLHSPHTTTVAALRAAEVERDAIGENVHRPAYERLVAIARAGVPQDAVLPLLAHAKHFDLIDFLDFDELQDFVSSIASAAAEA
jgi:hypothetical protein